MAAPMTVNTDVKSDVSVSNSCNCCIPRRRKKCPKERKVEVIAIPVIIPEGTVDPENEKM